MRRKQKFSELAMEPGDGGSRPLSDHGLGRSPWVISSQGWPSHRCHFAPSKKPNCEPALRARRRGTVPLSQSSQLSSEQSSKLGVLTFRSSGCSSICFRKPLSADSCFVVRVPPDTHPFLHWCFRGEGFGFILADH